MPWDGRRPKILPSSPFAILFMFFSLATSRDSGAQSPSSFPSPKFALNYAAPPADGTEVPASERELAQLAIQELLQLQREQQQILGTEKSTDRQKTTGIWPYSLYEQQMAKIFGERKKGATKEEDFLKSNTPVIIHLPAYRSTAANGGNGAGGASTWTSQGVKSKFARVGSNRSSQGSNNNPIRPQSNRWHRTSNGEEEKVGGSAYSSVFGAQPKGENRLSNANRITSRLKSSSAEHLLITRPEAMFTPLHAHRNGGHRPAQLRPIEPINNSPPGHHQKQQQQLFIKNVMPSGALMPNANAFTDGNENTIIDQLGRTDSEGGNKRLSPPISAFVPGGGGALSSSASVSSSNLASSNLASSNLASSNLASPLAAAQPPAPLAGSPFDLLASSMSNSGAVQPNALLSQLPNPLQLLSQGSTLEQITSLARNLIQMSNGKNDLLSSLSKAIGSPASAADSAASKLTSTAVQSIAKSASKVAAQGERTAVVGTNNGGDVLKTLFSSSAANGTTGTEQEQKELVLNGTSSDLFNGLPAEQRILLEAAMKNGELDLPQTANSKTELNEETVGEAFRTKLVNSESRLMEWIQQNRPRPPSEQQSPQAIFPDKTVAINGVEKLPYYGKYCGHFVEQTNLSRQHNVAGAVWAIDERRLLISNFHFQPFEHSENVTFWAGPAKHTGTSQDFFPSENGFFLPPAKLDANTFALWPAQKRPAHTRAPILPINGKDYYGVNGTTGTGKTAEEEEEETAGANRIGRRKRNLYSELYEQMAPEGPTSTTTTTARSVAATAVSATNERGGFFGGTSTATGGAVVPVHFDGMPHNFHIRGTTNDNNGLAIDPAAEEVHLHEECHWGSLGWHGGNHHILLTLPDNSLIKTLNWLSIWDHSQKQTVALVLIPSSAAGATFQPPSSVQLRPLLPPNVSTGKRVQSGPIRVLNTKTIELTEFSLSTEGLPMWFMVGKEIVPNRNGHIVPIFNRTTQSFDCDSLRDFHNETVTLRLSDPLDIKDVFWFSVYSIPRSQSLAHIYIPYNDMQLPPDLLALPTPQCVWTPPSPG
uniref:DM13 domain-containing protein n=1 Tax=Globodera rostochiensis TaxID=31243 RepID=A0A914HYD2_GLORO